MSTELQPLGRPAILADLGLRTTRADLEGCLRYQENAPDPTTIARCWACGAWSRGDRLCAACCRGLIAEWDRREKGESR